MNHIRTANRALQKCCSWICVALMVAMVVTVFIAVVFRYLFGLGFSWSDEMPRFFLLWLVYLGAAVVVADDDHIRITILDELLDNKGKKWLRFVQTIGLIVYAVLVVRYSLDTMSLQAHAVSASMRLPMQFVYSVFPIAGCLMLLHSVVNMLCTLTNRKEVDGE